jgi:hypothetical protein
MLTTMRRIALPAAVSGLAAAWAESVGGYSFLKAGTERWS